MDSAGCIYIFILIYVIVIIKKTHEFERDQGGREDKGEEARKWRKEMI